jgi:hypothetical protein
MKKQCRAEQCPQKDTGFSGAVHPDVSDEDLFVSQRGNDRLFTALSSVISELPGTYECFGVRLSVMDAHDERHGGIKSFLQVHAVLPETGLLQRLEPESRFLLRGLLYPTMGERDENDFGLKALCHHFHNQPLFTRMMATKSDHDRQTVEEASSLEVRRLAKRAS